MWEWALAEAGSGVSHPDERLVRLPKAELHVHLDGSVRPDTLLDLARARGVALPADTPDALATRMAVSGTTHLEEYLERFAVTLSVLQDADAVERVAYELALDGAAENVRWMEIRFCPLLNTQRGLSADEVVEAAIEGCRRAEGEADVRTGIIVCALRTLDPGRSVELAELAVTYLDRGVCGFDIAGAEDGHPVRDHAEAFDLAASEGVPITVHAGEAYGPDSIREALDMGHAQRIGHGTRLGEDQDLLEEVRRRRIPLEVCLTSNVQTGVVPSLEAHPARRYLMAGIPVTLSTDNRLISGVSLTDEYRNAQEALGFTWPEVVAVARAGFEHAFAPGEVRSELLSRFDGEVAGLTAEAD